MTPELLDPETVKIINKLGYNFFSALVAMFAFFGLTGRMVLSFAKKAVAHDIKQEIDQKHEDKINSILQEHKKEIDKLEQEIGKLKEKIERLKLQIVKNEKTVFVQSSEEATIGEEKVSRKR